MAKLRDALFYGTAPAAYNFVSEAMPESLEPPHINLSDKYLVAAQAVTVLVFGVTAAFKGSSLVFEYKIDTLRQQMEFNFLQAGLDPIEEAPEMYGSGENFLDWYAATFPDEEKPEA